MTDLETLLPHVLPSATTCPEPMAIHALREAAIVFCERTGAWRENDEFTTTGHEIEVMCVPPYAALHKIEAASFNGCRLEPITFAQSMDMQSDGPPAYITQAQPDAVRVVPPARGLLRVSMLLKPSADAEMIPSFLATHHGRDIAHGALGTLLILPNQPFTNPGLGGYFTQVFERACDRHFARNLTGQQRARIRTTARYL